MRRYWREILFFSVITAVYTAGVAPDMTWMSLGGDAPNYVSSAKIFGGAFMVGYPTYIAVGWLFERLPFNPFWNLGLLSALSTVATCIFIFLSVRIFTTNRWAPFIGAATYAGAFIVWSQSVIPEVYTFATLFAIAGTYFVLKRRYWIACGIFAVGLGTHLLIILAIVPCLVYIYLESRNIKLVGKLVGFGSLGLLTYLQVFLTGAESGISMSWRGAFLVQALGVIGALPLYPVGPALGRMRDFGAVAIVSIGAVLPLLFFLKGSKGVLLIGAIGGLSTLLYLVSYIPHWITYLTFSLAFVAILVGIGAGNLPYKRLLPVFLVLPIFFLGFNAYNYDIGRTVDKLPTSMRQYYNELEALPDGSIVCGHTWGHSLVVGTYYERVNGLRIITVDVTNPTPAYQEFCERKGVVMPEGWESWSFGDEKVYAEKLQVLNPDRRVYVAYLKETNPVIRFSVIPVDSYSTSLNAISRVSRNP